MNLLKVSNKCRFVLVCSQLGVLRAGGRVGGMGASGLSVIRLGVLGSLV